MILSSVCYVWIVDNCYVWIVYVNRIVINVLTI